MSTAVEYRDNSVVPLISAPQAVTAGWVAVGTVIDVRDINRISFWIDLAINDSTDVRFRLVGLKELTSSDKFSLPIKSVGPSVVAVEPEYYELTVDADTKIVLDFSTIDLVPYAQLQVNAGVVGATAGQLLSCDVSFGSSRSANV